MVSLALGFLEIVSRPVVRTMPALPRETYLWLAEPAAFEFGHRYNAGAALRSRVIAEPALTFLVVSSIGEADERREHHRWQRAR
jgi:hypothetical protein